MNKIILDEGEKLMVLGQKGVNVVLVNVRGEIYNRLDSFRETEEENNQSPQINVEGKPMIPPTQNTSGKVTSVTEDTHSTKQELNKEISKDYG